MEESVGTIYYSFLPTLDTLSMHNLALKPYPTSVFEAFHQHLSQCRRRGEYTTEVRQGRKSGVVEHKRKCTLNDNVYQFAYNVSGGLTT